MNATATQITATVSGSRWVIKAVPFFHGCPEGYVYEIGIDALMFKTTLIIVWMIAWNKNNNARMK